MRRVLAEDGALDDPEFYGEYRQTYPFPVTEEWESTYLRMTSWATPEEGQPCWSLIGLSFWGEIVSWLDNVGRSDVKMAVREAFMEDLSGDLGIPEWTQCLFDWGHSLNHQSHGAALQDWVDWMIYEDEKGLGLADYSHQIGSKRLARIEEKRDLFSDAVLTVNLDVCLSVANRIVSARPTRLGQPGASVVLGTCWCRIDSLLAHLQEENAKRYCFRPVIERLSSQMSRKELENMPLPKRKDPCRKCRPRTMRLLG